MNEILNLFIACGGVILVCLFIWWCLDRITTEKLLNLTNQLLQLKIDVDKSEKHLLAKLDSCHNHIKVMSENVSILITMEVEKALKKNEK